MTRAYRQDRLAKEIERIISDMVRKDLRDPRLEDKIIAITGAEVTRDGAYATVYVTAFDLKEDEEEAANELLNALKSASPLFRREIGKEMKIRRVPELIFRTDESMAYGRHIDAILDEIRTRETNHPGEEGERKTACPEDSSGDSYPEDPSDGPEGPSGKGKEAEGGGKEK